MLRSILATALRTILWLTVLAGCALLYFVLRAEKSYQRQGRMDARSANPPEASNSASRRANESSIERARRRHAEEERNGFRGAPKEYYDRFYVALVSTENARLFIRHRSSPTIGAQFHVVSDSSSPISGILQSIRPAVGDEAEFTLDDALRVGLIKWAAPPSTATISTGKLTVMYQGDGFDYRRVGSVKELVVDASTHPWSGGWEMGTRLDVRLPSNVRCLFEEKISWDNPEYVGVIQAQYGTGSLVCPGGVITEGTTPEIPTGERRWLLEIRSVSDLNADGLFELVIKAGGMYVANLELRAFDGSRLLPGTRVLYISAH